ncbi:hypothetical protein C0989_012350 [Termitomyces sp. Mn162]|nr:hypothetical protein C0989_012350 [Termitomyces sp. Mn162]
MPQWLIDLTQHVFYRKKNLSPLLDSIRTIISSNREDDVISGELAEIIGFDDIDLVMDILKDRSAVAQELGELSSKEQSAHHLSQEEARRRMEKSFRENAARPLFSGTAQEAPEVLPHVYSSTMTGQGNVLSQFGSKYMLPIGTEYEEVIVPPAKTVPPKASERLLPVSELEPLAKESFPGYTSLNRIQSIVYPTAYGSNENLLICAPTGAVILSSSEKLHLLIYKQGKTDVAMLTILRVIDQHRSNFLDSSNDDIRGQLRSSIQKDAFKIIYVAPMKALASEIVRKLSDMQMTKAEIAQTQIIVTTPEKWDVVTRKPTGEGELATSLKLLIIDEVHLLNEERGAVIETIVARTLRQVESSQSVIRIVGLSATLPNYMDVAEFLCVSKYKGLFYFDSSFRPVPLEQHFLGIKGKAGSPQSKKNLDYVTYLKVSELVAQGHQVMVFVHARKDTVKSALALKETALAEGKSDDFSCEDHPQYAMFRRSIGESRNKEMKQLFDHGFGIHHAGMLRSDRNMMERMFEARAIKVSLLKRKLATDFELEPLNESRFQGGLFDSLNAEIALGTVSNVNDAVRWLGYTYLFVRMRKNPFFYGVAREATSDDPQLGNKRHELVTYAAQKLAELRMIAFDRSTGVFTITDLGRIAAKYYIRHSSIEIFNKIFRQKMTEADVFGMLSMSTEFDQIQVRESEGTELEMLLERIPCDVKDGANTSQGKVNILLQGAVSRETVEDFALVSDMAYVMQNGGRIVRALLEIAISKKWANVTAVLMGISKAIEKRLWPFDQPLKQFDLKADIFYGLQQWADDWSPAQLRSLSAAELGKLVHLNERHGQALLDATNQFPAVAITYDLRPLGPDVLKISTRVKRAFSWSAKIHGTVEPFWLWIEDSQGLLILQLAHLVFRQSTDVLNVDFIISIPNGIPPSSATIRYVSDRWMGAEEEVFIPLESLVMPTASASNTPLLHLPLLPAPSVIRDPSIVKAITGRIDNLNAIQTQTFWSLVHTKCNALLCAPVGSGKSTLAHILIWQVLS